MKVTNVRYILRSGVIPALACAGLLQACGSTVSKQTSAGFQAQLDAGDYAGAADTATRSGQIGADGKSQNLPWSLNAGSALLDAGNSKASIASLENAETLMQSDDLDRMQSALDYKFATYDGVMDNTYKAIGFLLQGDSDNAGVEFRRAEDRQRRAEEHFAGEAAASRQKLAQAKDASVQGLFAKAEQSKGYGDEVGHISQMAAAYAPFENPFATYLGGIFLLTKMDSTASDHDAGLNKLKRANGMLGGHAGSVQSDIAWAKKASGGGTMAPQTWVVFENGQSATFSEIRLVLPMVTGRPMTLALPALSANAPASAYLNVQAGGVAAATSSVGSFDAVMASEFHSRMPIILASAIVEVVLKNGLSVGAQQSDNQILGLVATVAANVSTADTRSWTALPKEFQAVRVATPSDGRIDLTTADGAALGDIQVPTDRSSIVYVKMQSAGAKPSLQVIKL